MHLERFIDFQEAVSVKFQPTAYGRQRMRGPSAFQRSETALFARRLHRITVPSPSRVKFDSQLITPASIPVRLSVHRKPDSTQAPTQP